MTVDAEVDERTMREIYLPAFEAGGQEGRRRLGDVRLQQAQQRSTPARTRSCSTATCASDWGFDGFVISDWGAVHSTAPSAIAGLDLEMHAFAVPAPATPVTGTGGRFFDAGKLRPRWPTGRCRRPAWTRWSATSSADVPPGPLRPPHRPERRELHRRRHARSTRRIARRAAADATVMLKNRSGLLPLPEGARRPHDRGHRLGRGPDRRHELGLRRRVLPHRPARAGWSARSRGSPARRCANGDRVVYVDGSSQADAAAAAAAADVAVVVANDGSSEGADRPDLGLHPGDLRHDLLPEPAGRPDRDDRGRHRGQPGLRRRPRHRRPGARCRGWRRPAPSWCRGTAASSTATPSPTSSTAGPSPAAGSRRPSRSRRSRPRSRKAQYPGVGGVAKYSDGLLVGYRAYDAHRRTPLFPFGFGLGYTTFSYRGLERDPGRSPGQGLAGGAQHREARRLRGPAGLRRLPAQGRRAAAPAQGVHQAPARPRRLQAGHDHAVAAGLRTLEQQEGPLVIEPGTYRIFAGPDSRSLPLRATVRLSPGQGVSRGHQPGTEARGTSRVRRRRTTPTRRRSHELDQCSGRVRSSRRRCT